MRLTVLGCGSAKPEPDTAASGLLVESATGAVLLDCGQGIARRLGGIRDPRTLDAVVIGHMHADHYVDLAALRYLYPWDGASERLPVHLPPGGHARLTALAEAISERPTFFDDAFDVREYDPAASLQAGGMRLRFIAGRHYVPAWGVDLVDAAGARIVYAGDTGPSERLVAAARAADLLVIEATLGSTIEDDAERGHLTADEALAIGREARAGFTLITHYPSAQRADLIRRCAVAMSVAAVALPGLAVTVDRGLVRIAAELPERLAAPPPVIRVAGSAGRLG